MANMKGLTIALTNEEAVEFLEKHDARTDRDDGECTGFMLMARGVDAENNPKADQEWTEITMEDIANVRDGTYHDLQLWPRCTVCTG